MGKVALTGRIYKVLSVFTGTQMLGILCSVVRTKLVALWIGAAGVGLFGLFNAAIELLTSVSQLGVRASSVRDIAAAPAGERREAMVHVVRRWCMWLGLGGMALALLASPLLSMLSFGNTSWWGAFALLSVVLLLGSVTAGEQAVMQGRGELRRLATTSLVGTVVALAVSVPLLWFGRIQAIVPVLIVYWLALAVVVKWGSWRGSSGRRFAISNRELFKQGTGFVKLGIFISVSGASVWLATYLLMSWINNRGGEDLLGYFQAGNTLVLRYVGVLFTAISMEFYPRLSAASHSLRRMAVYANHEIGVILRVGAPLAVLFVFVAPWIVRLLYAEEFLVIVPFVVVAMAGMVARAGAWCVSYMLLARGDGRLYMICEIASAAIYLALNVIGYELCGLVGFGYAFVVWYLLYLAMMLVVGRVRYRFSLNRYATMWLAGSMAAVMLSAWLALC